MLLDPLPLSQTVTPSQTPTPSSVTYFMDGLCRVFGQNNNLCADYQALCNFKLCFICSVVVITVVFLISLLPQNLRCLLCKMSTNGATKSNQFYKPYDKLGYIRPF